MMADRDSTPRDLLSRGERRRRDREVTERAKRWLAERDALLETQLAPGEVVVARGRRGRHPMVTDRRMLFAEPALGPSDRDGWTCTPLPFSVVSSWATGQEHDGRPLIRLEHPPIPDSEHVPAHRFLWFEWGDAERPVTRTTTTFGFSRNTDPVLVAIREGLERNGVAVGEPFVVRPAGTREARIDGSSRAYLKRPASR